MELVLEVLRESLGESMVQESSGEAGGGTPLALLQGTVVARAAGVATGTSWGWSAGENQEHPTALPCQP